GLLVAAFFAAYMSTIATHLNWGTSYIVNDFYRRFVKQDADEKHYVTISRVVIIVVMAISLGLMQVMDSISGAWSFIIEASAGLGLVLILRWFWWRVNAWSEIAAMLAPIAAFSYVKFFTSLQFPESLFFIVAFVTDVWLVVTFLTKPTEMVTLKNFYERIHPGGWWKPVAETMPHVKQDAGFGKLFLDWLAGIVLVYSTLFGIGKLIFGEVGLAMTFLGIAALAGVLLYVHLTKIGWESVAE
ncbi:MAG: sodium:proline symporter, partial [Bacteroidetes bacterium]